MLNTPQLAAGSLTHTQVRWADGNQEMAPLTSIKRSQTWRALFASGSWAPARLEAGPSRLITQTGPFCVAALPLVPVNHVLLARQGAR